MDEIVAEHVNLYTNTPNNAANIGTDPYRVKSAGSAHVHTQADTIGPTKRRL